MDGRSESGIAEKALAVAIPVAAAICHSVISKCMRTVFCGAHIFTVFGENIPEREGFSMKQEEQKPKIWEVVDPKPPIVESGGIPQPPNTQQ